MKVVNSSQDAAFYAQITKIVNFFRRTSHGGFLFCVCNNGKLIKQINQQIIKRTEQAHLTVKSLYISSTHIDDFLNLVREAVQDKPNGIIINNLDELILLSRGEFITHLNFSREILIELNIPLLFWFSEKNISLLANKGRDLFIRKDRGVIYFSDITGASALQRLEHFYVSDQEGKEKYENLNLKIKLFETQLEEACKKGYSNKRIATEIAAELIDLYLDAYLIDEAHSLFEKYKSYYDKSEDLRFIHLCAKVYETIYKLDKALEYYLKSEKIYIEVGDRARLGTTYNNIGLIYSNKGEGDRALEYYLKSEKIFIEVGDRAGLGTTYNNIGLIYSKKGEWDRALEYYLKSEKIFIEVGDRAGLAYTYNGIGIIYSNKGEWDRALEYYFKSEKIRIEVGNRAGLGTTYNNIGIIYSNKGERDRALEYFLKSEKIRIEVGDRAGLAYSYFNIGASYLNQNEKEKAYNYIILAGYIAKILGMKHELSSVFARALEPVFNELGAEKFMEIGKRLYEEKGLLSK